VSRLDDRRAEEPTSSLDDCRIVRRGLWVTFESSALEGEYWQERRRLACTLSAAYVSAVLLGLAIFSIDDYRLLGWTPAFARLAAVRLFLIIVSLAVLWRIRLRPPRRQLEWLILVWALVLVTGHGMIAAARPVDYLVTTVNGRAVVLLGFLMVPSAWAVMTPASLLLSALYSAFIVAAGPSHDYEALLVSSSWLFLLVNVLACIWAVQHEYANRRQFTALRSETRLREQLDAAKTAADESNLAKSEFLATMSHEIRTPMNGVLGFANLLSETNLTDEQRLYVSTIRGSGETLLAIINDILDFSKIEAGQLVLERIPYDLRKTVEELTELMSVSAEEKHLTLSLSVADDVPSGTLGDPGRLRQVLLNLVGNALKFTEAGQVRIVVSRAGDTSLRFAVTDTGIGLTPAEIGRLFHRFSQADASTTRRFGGSGLGLAICKRLVELMGGTIGVESRKGEGSTFWFTVPAVPADLARTEAPAARAAGTPHVTAVRGADGRTPRVLLAEDNATNQFLAKRMLSLLGCAVDVAANGREAVDLWSRLPYDVIFMDCQMPEMDGLEATAEIRRREREACAAVTDQPSRVRIIACSAGVTVSERERCFAVGMDDFVAKPLSRDELRRALHDGVAAANGRNAA
jgi:signal transduction histidine kinase/ActR/RegA family two-component response regulator